MRPGLPVRHFPQARLWTDTNQELAASFERYVSWGLADLFLLEPISPYKEEGSRDHQQ
jgi:hypothetical protein